MKISSSGLVQTMEKYHIPLLLAYLAMLEVFTYPELTKMEDDVWKMLCGRCCVEDDVIFQQDGAQPHWGLAVLFQAPMDRQKPRYDTIILIFVCGLRRETFSRPC